MYQLTRDDGEVLRVSGNVWEAALELACRHGWQPAGTEAPRSAAPSGRPARDWDRLDYFSHDSQHVGSDDAHALAGAVLRALLRVRERASARPDTGAESAAGASVAEAVRRPAGASGSIRARRNALERIATFAHQGGFTIGCTV